LDDKDLVNLQKRYRNILTRGEKTVADNTAQAKWKTCKLAKSDAHNLLERLQSS